MATKFKVGDKIVGNVKANKDYGITVEGWKGEVVKIKGYGKIEVRGERDGNYYTVLSRCFDKVVVEPKTSTKKYSVDEEFILEGFKAASGEMKTKLRKKFPEVFKSKEIEFDKDFRTSQDLSSNEVFYIGNGHAPIGLEKKCLILRDGVNVKVKKNGKQTILVFTKDVV